MFDKSIRYEKTYAGPIWQGTISYIGTYVEVAKAFEILTDSTHPQHVKVIDEEGAKLGADLIPISVMLVISPDLPEKGHLTVSGYLSKDEASKSGSTKGGLTADVFTNVPTAQQLSTKNSKSLIDSVEQALQTDKPEIPTGPFGIIKLPKTSVTDFSAVVDSSVGVIEQLTLRRSRAHSVTPAKGQYFLYMHAWEPVQGEFSARIYSEVSIVTDDEKLSAPLKEALTSFKIKVIGEPYVVNFTQTAIEGSESGYRISVSFVCI
jgi:hypothetical protein